MAAHCDHAAAIQFRELDEHQTDRTESDNGNGVARLGNCFFKTTQHAGQRLDQCGVVIAHLLRNQVGISLYDAFRNADVLRICAIVEQQILAKVLEPFAAEKTLVTRRGISRYNALSNSKLGNIVAYGDYIARQLMSEHSRWDDHAGMIPATQNLNVRAAGQSDFDPDQDVSVTDWGHSHRLHLQVFLAIEHSSDHLVIHYHHLWG